MTSSLAGLVSNMKKEDLTTTRQLLRKGVYPYDYVNYLEKFSEEGLPLKTEFYSKFNEEDISDEGYRHAINVWNEFKIKYIRECHDVFL